MLEMKNDVLRFKPNKIVLDLSERWMDMNEISIRYQQGLYTIEEKYQFLALIGYSVDGLWGVAVQDRILVPTDEE